LSDLVEQLVHGLTLGSLYAMVATGLALMFGVVRLINFAHGEFYMLGGYAFWYAYAELGLPYPVAGLAAVAAMAVFGLAYERAVIRTILARTWHVQLIATLATSITLTNLAILAFGTQPKEVPTRLSAAIPPVADRLSATLRKYTLRKESLPYLLERDSLSAAAASFLWAIMQARRSLIVSGPPGSGKTSLLSALLAASPANHCIRCAEEIRELSAPITHGSYYEARPPALDGSGEISLRDLVKFLLSMRPDLIVVGEVRGAEAFELTRAVNAGCGFLCTVHANSAREALTALVNAAIMAGENVGESIVRKVFSSAIDFVVHLDRDDVNRVGPDEEVRRQVMEVLAVVPAMTDDFSTEPIFVREAIGKPLVWTGAYPPEVDLIERSLPEGATMAAILEGRVSAPFPGSPDTVATGGSRVSGARR